MKSLTKFIVITLFLALLYNSFTTSISTTPSLFDYCTITCDGKKHTMCEYPEGGEPECADYKHGISDTEKKGLIEVHNAIRQGVALGRDDVGQPPAANMMELVWSDEAAAIAQRWADQCTQGENHDVCRSLHDKTNGGQNIVVRENNTCFEIYQFQQKSVREWYSANITNFTKEDIPHYKYNPATAKLTQLIWARSKFFGCGLSYKCSPGGQDHYRLVCNYYPAGNIAGEPIFIEGKPCTKCPNAKCSQLYPELCEGETPVPVPWTGENTSTPVSYTPRQSSTAVPFLSVVSISHYIGWWIGCCT